MRCHRKVGLSRSDTEVTSAHVNVNDIVLPPCTHVAMAYTCVEIVSIDIPFSKIICTDIVVPYYNFFSSPKI